jgi:hypothetical protein
MRPEFERVVDLEDEDVHAAGREVGELGLDRPEVGVVPLVEQVEGDPGDVGRDALACGLHGQGNEE